MNEINSYQPDSDEVFSTTDEVKSERRRTSLILEYLRMAEEGDEDSFDKLVSAYAPIIDNLIKEYSGDQFVEDLRQEGYVVVTRVLREFIESDRREALTEKTLRMLYASIYNGVRRAISKYNVEEASGEALQETLADSLRSQLSSGKLKEQLPDILTERELLIITKSFGLDGDESLTYDEMAATLGISRSKIWWEKNTALRKIEKWLSAKK